MYYFLGGKMAFSVHVRNLNKNEKYACHQCEIKKLFSQTNFCVGFGYFYRNFEFDSRDFKHPFIRKETVIASAEICKRIPEEETSRFLNFYVIKNVKYDKKTEKNFVKLYLPQILEWVKKIEKEPETAIFGIKHCIVTWENEIFQFYSY